MKVQIQFFRYKNLSDKEGEALEKQGLEPESELFFDEAYIDVSAIKVFSKTEDGNIKVWFENMEAWVIKWDKDIWDRLVDYFYMKGSAPLRNVPWN